MKRPLLLAGGLTLFALMVFPIWSTVVLLSPLEPSTQEPLEAPIEDIDLVKVAPASDRTMQPQASLPEPDMTLQVGILPETHIVIEKKADLHIYEGGGGGGVVPAEGIGIRIPSKFKTPKLVKAKPSPVRKRLRNQRIETKAEVTRARKTRRDLEQIKRRLERGM